MDNMKIENNSPEKPTQVRSAVNLFYTALGVGVLLLSLNFSRVASGFFIGSTVLTIVTSTISIFLIIKISAGNNWARVTMLIWFLIQFIPSIPSILQNFRANFLVIFQIALNIIAFIFLFQSPSNNWFKYPNKTIPRQEQKQSTFFLVGLILGFAVGLPIGNRSDLIPSWFFGLFFGLFILGLFFSFFIKLKGWKISLLTLSGLGLGLCLGSIFFPVLVTLMGGM